MVSSNIDIKLSLKKRKGYSETVIHSRNITARTKWQKYKQWSPKHYTENKSLNNTTLTKHRG